MSVRIKYSKKKLRRLLFCGIVFLILLSIIGVLGYQLYRTTRMNQYSKNIWLSHNYFLNDYDDTETEEEQSEEVNPLLAETGIIAGVDSVYYAGTDTLLQRIYSLFSDGIIDTDTLNEIVDLVKGQKYAEAAKYVNEYLGFDYIPADLSSKHIDVPYISQKGTLPNGCEAVSATMLLQFNGYDISAVDFSDNYLDKDKVYIKWGCRYGPNPYLSYAGDPKSEKGGWGCFAPVIVRGLNKCLKNDDYAYNLSGKELNTLINDYVANGIPVAVWVTRDMEEINQVYQWQSYDKKETFLYPVGQHCMVLTGYDNEYYYFNDPYDGNGQVKYEKEKVVYSYNSMGRQAVAILKKHTSAKNFQQTSDSISK